MTEPPVPRTIKTTAVPTDFHRFRVLYSDGTVIDFIADRDDSTLRDHMLSTHWPDKGKMVDERRIAGVADLGRVETYTPGGTDEADGTPADGAGDRAAPDRPRARRRS